MANLLNELVYITLTDCKETSATLSTVADAVLTQIITESQYTIDNYIWSYGEKVVSTQSFIFPTVIDSVPSDIKLATVWITEQLYLQGSSLWSIKGEKVIEESNMSRSVKYSDKESYLSSIKSVNIPKKALNVLDKYKSNFIWQVV